MHQLRSSQTHLGQFDFKTFTGRLHANSKGPGYFTYIAFAVMSEFFFGFKIFYLECIIYTYCMTYTNKSVYRRDSEENRTTSVKLCPICYGLISFFVSRDLNRNEILNRQVDK